MKKQKIVGPKRKVESDRPSELDYCGIYADRIEFINNEKEARRQEK